MVFLNNVSLSSLTAVSVEKLLIIYFICVLLYVICYPSLATFKVYFFIFVSSRVILMRVGVVCFEFICLQFLESVNLCLSSILVSFWSFFFRLRFCFDFFLLHFWNSNCIQSRFLNFYPRRFQDFAHFFLSFSVFHVGEFLLIHFCVH